MYHARMAIFDRIRSWFSGGADDSEPTRIPSADELVLLARPQGEPEALMLKDMLDKQGIAAMVKNRDASAATRGAMGSFWAYELWVMHRDLAKAREIVGEDAVAQ